MLAHKWMMAVVMLGLSACANTAPVARNLDMSATTLSVAGQNAPQPIAMAYNVTDIRVDVPQNLRVSEANVYYPIADIVWRGDMPGPRHAQVAAVIRDGIAAGTKGMTAGREVVLLVDVTRFHALTEKTRYSFGGMHSVKFKLTVLDALTGATLDGPRLISADIKASGGSQALAEDYAGRTQKVVIQEHLAEVIRAELAKPVASAPLVSRNSIDPMRLGGLW